ncbi:MAG: cytochrome C [Gammaproteobacteria bacterium]
MKRARHPILASLILAGTASAAIAAGSAPDAAMIERGRYIARIAGCNDCHTPNYAISGGAVPEQQWLTGDRLGWQGPWGTTYPSNLRLALSRLSEDDWVRNARTLSYRPPMPWFALRDMDETDLRAFYRFVRALGPSGEPAPAYLPPGAQPHGLAIVFPAAPE